MADDIGGVWRTVGGKRIFIKDGQDLASAMKESGKFDEGEKYLRSQMAINDAKKITMNNNHLNCCKEVSEEIVEQLKQKGYDAKVTEVGVYNKDNTNSSHTVVEYNDKLYDYTSGQYFDVNNPESVDLRIYYKIKDDIYSDNRNISINTYEDVFEYISSENYRNEMIIIKNS